MLPSSMSSISNLKYIQISVGMGKIDGLYTHFLRPPPQKKWPSRTSSQEYNHLKLASLEYVEILQLIGIYNFL